MKIRPKQYLCVANWQRKHTLKISQMSVLIHGHIIKLKPFQSQLNHNVEFIEANCVMNVYLLYDYQWNKIQYIQLKAFTKLTRGKKLLEVDKVRIRNWIAIVWFFYMAIKEWLNCSFQWFALKIIYIAWS